MSHNETEISQASPADAYMGAIAAPGPGGGEQPPAASLANWWRIAALVVIVAGSFWLTLNPAWVQRLGQWGYVGAFAVTALASATVLLPAPGIAVIFAMGSALDPVLLGIVAGLGSTLGELSGYIAGASGRALIADQPRYQWLSQLTQRYGAWLLFVLAVLPMPVFDLAGIAAGALKMRLSLFLLSVGCGKIIKHTLVALAGAGSLDLFRQFF